MTNTPHGPFAPIAAVLIASGAAASLHAQTASALLREGDPLGPNGSTVSSISNTAVNHAGGYAATVNTENGATLSHVWGSATGGPVMILITEATYGPLVQTSFEGFFGISDDGSPAYSPLVNNTDTGFNGLDSVWVGATPVLAERDPIPSLPGQFSVFNSRPGITADGQPYWVGGFGPTQGGSTVNRAVFFGLDATPVIRGGDVIGGTDGGTVFIGTNNVNFDFRFSAMGTNSITPVLIRPGVTADDDIVVINGDAATVDGMVVREASPIPASAGGLPGENWDNFDNFGITEDGTWLVTGDTDADTAADEFVALNGVITYREGDTVDGEVLSGALEGAYLNEDGDVAYIWDIENNTREALFLNDRLILAEGDAVDFDGDGTPEETSLLADFTGISALTLSDRDEGGGVSIYFTADADVNGVATEAFFRVVVPGDGKPPCPADFNMSGEVNSDDYFAFLDAFFKGDADFNDDGVTNSDDYFAFLDAFFKGC